MNKKLKPAVSEHSYQPGGVGKLWWSPTNKHIIIALFDVGEKEHFSKLIMDGHEELAQFNHTYFYGVEWSSNGKHFAYVVKPPDILGFRIFYDKKLIQSPFHVSDLAFSPDGEHFAYTINDSGSTFVIHDDKKEPNFEIPHLMAKAPWSHHIGGLVFSPDSQHLAYAGRDGNKWFVICDGKKGALYDDILTKPIWDNGKLKYIAVKQVEGTAKVILISEEIEHGK